MTAVEIMKLVEEIQLDSKLLGEGFGRDPIVWKRVAYMRAARDQERFGSPAYERKKRMIQQAMYRHHMKSRRPQSGNEPARSVGL